MDTVISKVSGKKVHTKTEKHVTAMQWSWYASAVYYYCIRCSVFLFCNKLFHNFQKKCMIYNHTDKCSQKTVTVSGFDSTLINLKINERTYLNCRLCLSNIFQRT